MGIKKVQEKQIIITSTDKHLRISLDNTRNVFILEFFAGISIGLMFFIFYGTDPLLFMIFGMGVFIYILLTSEGKSIVFNKESKKVIKEYSYFGWAVRRELLLNNYSEFRYSIRSNEIRTYEDIYVDYYLAAISEHNTHHIITFKSIEDINLIKRAVAENLSVEFDNEVIPPLFFDSL